MRFTWDESKRRVNLKAHGIDFLMRRANSRVRPSPSKMTVLFMEQRFVTLGFLGGVAVSIVHTETPERIQCHLFSLSDPK